MNTDDELGDLRQLWRAASPAGADVTALRCAVDAQTRHQVQVTFIAVAINVAVLGWGLWRVLAGRVEQGWNSFVATLIYSAVAWTLVLWLTRGLRAPRDESTAAYLDVAIRRSRAHVLAAPLGVGVYIVGLAIGIGMRMAQSGQELGDVLRLPQIIVTGAIVLPIYAAIMGVTALVHHRRLRRLRALQRSLLGG